MDHFCVRFLAPRPACGHAESFTIHSSACTSEPCTRPVVSWCDTPLPLCADCFYLLDPQTSLIRDNRLNTVNPFQIEPTYKLDLLLHRYASCHSFRHAISVAATESRKLTEEQEIFLSCLLPVLVPFVWNHLQFTTLEDPDSIQLARELVIRLDRIWIRNRLLLRRETLAPPPQKQMISAIGIADLPEDEKESCTICHEPFTESGEHPMKSVCNHVFGSDCIQAWLKNSATCPMCRRMLKLPVEQEEDGDDDGHERWEELWVEDEGLVNVHIPEGVPEWFATLRRFGRPTPRE